MTAPSWSTRADVVSKLRRRWESGELLGGFASGAPWAPLDVPLRSPTARDLANRLPEVQDWVRQWRQVDHKSLRIQTKSVGGRIVGSNEVPDRVWVDSYDQLWAVLGVTGEVRRFSQLLEATLSRAPRIAEWMISRPLEVLRHREAWTKLVDTVLWIDSRADSAMYVRQIDVPGVDTKFIEGSKKILAALLDQQLDEHRVDLTRPPADFAGRYRLRKKPEYVRFRHLGKVAEFSELQVRVDELAQRPLKARKIFVVENEITYLAFPPVPDAVVLFGGGYSLSRLEPLSWLAERDLTYWGDLDTHGFAILNQLRHLFGQVRSVLMDRATLLGHESQWVKEPTPTNAYLDRLDPDEAALYTDLVEDALGKSIRLEQERVSYSAIEQAVR